MLFMQSLLSFQLFKPVPPLIPGIYQKNDTDCDGEKPCGRCVQQGYAYICKGLASLKKPTKQTTPSHSPAVLREKTVNTVFLITALC